MDLGLSLKIALAKADINQTKLANDLGIDRQMVSRWVRTGNIPRDTVAKLSEYFGLKPSEFVALGE